MEDYGGRNQLCVNIHKRQTALPPAAAAAAAAPAPTGAKAVATTAAVVIPTTIATATATATGHRKEQHEARKSSSYYQ